jgi:hypothetical protein
MSDTLTQTRPAIDELAQLAERIKTEHSAIKSATKQLLVRALAVGDALLKAKAKVDHGQWLPWLTKNCQLSDRTAQVYMKLANGRQAIERHLENKSAEAADLTITQALEIIASGGGETATDGGAGDASGSSEIGGTSTNPTAPNASDKFDKVVVLVVNALKKLKDREAAKAAAHTLAKRLVELEYLEAKIK